MNEWAGGREWMREMTSTIIVKKDKNVKFFSVLKVSMGYIFLNAKVSFIK